MRRPKFTGSLAATALVVGSTLSTSSGSAFANVVFEGTGFSQHWVLEDCISISADGMTIVCPPEEEFAIGCYARIDGEQWGTPSGFNVDMEFDGYAWLAIYDECGRVFEFQPQPAHDHTRFTAWFECAGTDREFGIEPWAPEPQMWSFELINYFDLSGRPMRRLTTTTPAGDVRVHELEMPSFYPLVGELSFYFGSGTAHYVTIKRVELVGEDVVGVDNKPWATIKATYR